MNAIIAAASFALLISCSQPQPGNDAAADSLARLQLEQMTSPASSAAEKPKYNFTDPKFILEEHKHKFQEGRIEKFDEEFFNSAMTDTLYPVLDREAFDVFQSNEWVHDRITESTPYYYVMQYTGGHTGIIIYKMNDGWVNEYIYMAYNKQGKLIGTVVLAGRGGEGGGHTEMTGEFINDSVYIKKTIDTEIDFETGESKVELNTTDEITIHYNGKIETRAIK